MGVGTAQFEIVDGEFGVEAEAGSGVIGGGGLRFFAGGCDRTANASPEIDFVGEIEGEDEIARAFGTWKIGSMGGLAN